MAWSPTLRIWATPIPVEQDDSLLDWDRRQLYALGRDVRLPLLRYHNVNQIARVANATGAVPAGTVVTVGKVREVADRVDAAIEGLSLS